VTVTGTRTGTDIEVDGRRLRRERNRLAVVDALLALYRRGNLRPSSAEIAEQAGLSPRSLFRYFDDVDDLCRAAVARQEHEALPLLAVDAVPGDPLAARISALVDQRLRLYAAIAPAAAVSRIEAPFQPALADELGRSRAYLRRQLRLLFAPELRSMAHEDADAALAAADVLCSFESYQLLRHAQGLSPARAGAALRAALTALLAGGHAGGLAGTRP
jgi:AcrR family transcriptional regulator